MKNSRSSTKATPTWQTTSEQNLLRNSASGQYYARFLLSGKRKWVHLKTDVWTVAKLRLNDERARVERIRQSSADVGAGAATMGDLLALYQRRIEDRVGIKDGYKRGLLDVALMVVKTWPGFKALAPNKVTRPAVSEWVSRLSREGTGFIVPGAKGKSSRINGSSPSLINKGIDAIRQMLDIAVKQGQLGGNPLQARGLKLKLTPRKPKLPEATTLSAIFHEIQTASGNAKGAGAADLCRFLSLTGCRLSEARNLTWSEIDLGCGIIHVCRAVKGKTDAATREVPMIPAARTLIERLYAARQQTATVAVKGVPQVDPKTKVLPVSEAGKSLVRACKKVGAPVLTHHDLRDAFATACIEAGVDIPTVAAWLGHADGGALLMKVYAHHRRPHSLAQAAKVNVAL